MTSKPDKKDKSRKLSFITPRATRRAAQARSSRTTRFIARLRFFLPFGGLLILTALAIWPMIDPNKLRSKVMENIPDLVIKDLHFTGLDSKNEPYSMRAAQATRPGGAANIYDLKKPEAEVTLQNGAWISGRAEYGRYDQDTKRLWLGGDVQLFHDKGYQFTTDEAQVDIDADNAWGEKPVLIQGDFGEIRGQGFEALDSGKTFIVKGPARALLNLHGGKPSDTPAGTKRP